MTDSSTRSNEPPHAHWRWLWLAPLLVLAWLAFTGSGRSEAARFLASLRMARPEAVSVTIPAFSGPTGTHRLQDAVAAMLADSVRVDREQVDTAVGDDVSVAARLAGSAAALLAGRSDGPTLTVEGPRAISMTVDRSRLRTILAEAGRSGTAPPASVDGATLTLNTPAGIRAKYGHCPAPMAMTLQAQLIGRPPPSADYRDCLVSLVRPVVTAHVPAGLDMARLTGVALEVAGMSPKQSADFQRILDWRAALTLRMPRFIRSYNVVQIDGAPGMLLDLGGRRGPTYELIWVRDGSVHTLAGYGSASDAVPLAASVH